MDFSQPGLKGERIVTESRVVDLGLPVLLAASMYPVTNDPCTPGGRGFLNVLDPFTGAGLDTGVLDTDRDGSMDNDRIGARFIGSVDLDVGVPTQPQLMRRPDGGATILVGGSGDSTGTQGPSIGQVDTGPGAAKTLKFKGRLAWREVVKE
ncbi:hypothetical protein [Ramlibacter rhizophilus]|uniref:Uncharacterized protein n=1 Tax=Ramlibacter rhizophilus TaxID=1781167 RepID=A0A4Z0C1H1_9BURK|nr:hypothetical protein [Ramlibacter rhizophilus]TFZ04654.1 hypothetical protein EZ242_02580 [Ramlibacter rhizophilus]